MCSVPTGARVIGGVLTFGGSEAVIYGANKIGDAINQPPETVNYRGDTLSDSDKATLDLQDPATKAKLLMNWLVGSRPKDVSPGEVFAQAAITSGEHAKGAAGAGMGGLFGWGLYAGGDSTTPLVGAPPPPDKPLVGGGTAAPAAPDPNGPTSNGGNTGQPGTGPMGPTQSVPNRGPGDVYPVLGGHGLRMSTNLLRMVPIPTQPLIRGS